MSKPHIELLIEDESGQDVVAYPFVNAKHVSLSNGMNIGEMIDGDVSMPTVTHDTTAIKVGVGDSDVSGSVVDGTVNMTVKGQTYQNILPDPTLRNEMQGRSMQRLNEGYDSIETVDGVSKSAILKGQTLVNGLSNPIIKMGGEYVAILSPTHLLINHGENTSGKKISVSYDWLGGKMRDGADYTLDIWILKNTMRRKDNPTERIGKINFNNYNTGYYSIPTGKTGHIVYEVTTPTTSTTERPYVETFTTCEGELEIQMVIREGKNLIPIEQHFEGMASCKMPVLTTSNEDGTKTNILSCQLAPLNQTMFEQGTFAETTPPNTQSYEQIKLGSEHLYTTRIRTKGTYKVVKGATYEVQLNDGYGIYVCYCKNGLYSATVNRWLDGISTFTVPNDCDEMFFAIRKTDNVAIAPSDYPLIGLKIHQEVVLRSLPNGIKDTLNLNTGEYVQRIGEVVVDGSNDERWFLNQNLGGGTYHQYASVNNLVNAKKVLQQTVVSDKLMSSPNESSNNCIWIYDGGTVVIHSSLATANELKTWLSQNPITIQYELATPVVKTVDLSSHGNWEKVVLDGSENWLLESSFNHKSLIEFKYAVGNGNIVSVISDRFATGGDDVERIACTRWEIYIRILKSKVNTVDEFKQWLSQNPITVWYQTTTTQDNSIREMLSFANGHIQVSSEAENSLLPFVQYEIPTKNSYHMDLMKANTQYTMKSKSASGTFTIDGTSYGAGTNGTFTTPTSMTNKLLVMSNKTNKEVMILEGDITSKTIPYFKGIKSAFEDEDRIEILSYGKNLFDMNRPYDAITDSQTTVVQDTNQITVSSADSGMYVSANFILDKDFFAGKTVTGSCLYESDEKDIGTVQISYQDGNGEHHYQWIKTPRTFTFPNNFIGDVMLCVCANNTGTPQSNTVIVKNIQLELGTKATTYEPSNTTKIPLLSPLRSLPNGVYDEIILNRENNNVKMIRRVGEVVLNGEEDWTHEDRWHRWYSSCMNMARANDYATMILNNSENLPATKNNTFLRDDTYGISGYELTSNYPNQNWIYIRPKNVSNTQALQSLLSQNPTTVLYELVTPIITEIDLEGYPYAYKDGHIFLNSDIAPTTQITYSINQAQQIESANENLQRHEKEISHLQKLIAQYIQVEYESTLLSLKI